MGWIRKIRICLISSVAVALIVLAVVFTVLRTFLPHATGYIEEIEKGISSQIGLPVSIGSLDADMHWFTPRLKVIDLVIFKEDGEETLFTLSEANFSLAYLDSIRFMMPMVGEISLHGAEVFIERHPNGKWVIQGFEVYERESTRDSEELIELILSADIALIDSQIHWRDFTGRSRNMDFDGASILLENYLGTQFVEIDVGLPPDMGERFRIIAEMDGDLRDLLGLEAKLHVSGTGLIFANWIDTTRIKEFVRGSGRLDTDFWVHINKAKIISFASNIKATDLKLVNVSNSNRTWFANRLETSIFWRDLNEGWRLDVRDLNLQIGNTFWNPNTDIVVANHENDWRVLASYLKPADFMPLINVLPEVVDVSAIDKYIGYLPAGEFYNFEAVFSDDVVPDLQLSTGFSDLDIDIAEKGISVKGLDGELHVDSNEVEFLIDSKDVIANTGNLLRWPLELDTVNGKVAVHIVDDTFKIKSDALYASNQHIETVSRANVDVSSDGKVFIDLHSNLANGVGEYAYRYVPASIMADGLVNWLDNAIVEGYAPSGSFIFHGSPNDFPFDDNTGIMLVEFDVEDGRLHFLDGWPDVVNSSARVRFQNASLVVENARSREKTGSEAVFNASIPDFREGLLLVSGTVRAQSDEVQQYVWNSGLDAVLGRALEHFQTSGEAELDINLDIPLSKRRQEIQELAVNGNISFADNELFFPITDYLVTGLNGRLSFTTTSLNGENIRGYFYGQPISINVTTVDDEYPVTRFHASGDWEVESLLKKFNWDFPSIVDGSSHWDVVMHVPHKARDYNVMFEASSDLQGVKVGLSDIISKSAAQSFPVETNLKILDDARQLKVTSGDRVDLVASFDDDNNWQFDVSSPVVTGKGKINADFDIDTTGEFDLDHLNLTAFMSADGGTAQLWRLKAAAIPSLRLDAKKFEWRDWRLDNVAFEADHHPRGMVINSITVKDPHVTVTGKGSWLRRSWRLDEETTFSFKIASPNIGNTLQRLGYSRYVDKSEMVATLHWQWPGAPYRFNWRTMSGNASVNFGEGIVTEIDPGAGGRFLGLFNLVHLPKRLGLDFEDVYKKGFVFDSIAGNYVFADGEAVTQDTEISASAADLTMMGRIGVENEDYDMVAIVRPHSSVASFAGGTLIGGPTIGVGLMVLQEIFGLDILGKNFHRIQGPWSDPVITNISQTQDDEPEDLFDEF
ncbi:MAG: hypothetical protein JSW45_12475 [Thiotrichales bacterium]|nr:MAG: hypothetical protein JSW45_12475 [Thiotrichales bacterium]